MRTLMQADEQIGLTEPGTVAIVANLFEKSNSVEFGAALDLFVESVVPFDLSTIFHYPSLRSPTLLHDGLRDFGNRNALTSYIEGTYILDPVYQACAAGVPAGLYRVDDLAPDSYFQSDYFQASELHLCISMDSGTLAEEIIFFLIVDTGYIAYSLMRSSNSARFSADEFSRISAVSQLVLAAMRMNWAGLSTEPQRNTFDRPSDFANQAFLTFETSRLTKRERQIVQLMLQGHSILSTATVLGIFEGTVRNHRKHVYAKLQISSQSELFASFLEHVLLGKETSPMITHQCGEIHPQHRW
jgi:DNA-binding CsgD family transcriptional regulator